MKEIYWRIILETSSREKAEEILDRILQGIGKANIVSLQPYWKNTEQCEIELVQPLEFNDLGELVLLVFQKINFFAPNWFIEIPQTFTVEDIELAGVLEKGISLSGISWMSFMIQDAEQ